jgi:hypothetical protein
VNGVITCCQFSKRIPDALKEANLPVQSSEDNTSKEETSSQAVLPENTGADEM